MYEGLLSWGLVWVEGVVLAQWVGSMEITPLDSMKPVKSVGMVVLLMGRRAAVLWVLLLLFVVLAMVSEAYDRPLGALDQSTPR